MVSVTGMTYDKMLTIGDKSLVDSDVVAGRLILTQKDGGKIDAGKVDGDQGPTGFTPVSWVGGSTSSLSLTTAVITAVPLWTYRSGDPDLVTVGSPDSNLTVNTTGLYLIYFSVTFNSNATGRRIAFIYQNGVEKRRVDVGCAAGAFEIYVSHMMLMTAGDILTVRVYQSSGVALALTGGNTHDLNVVKIM